MESLETLQQALSIDVRLEQLIILTAQLLQDLIQQEGSPCESLFNSSSIPTIPLVDFIRRLHTFTQFSPQCLVIAILYIDRYNLAQPDFTLNQLNVHKIVLATILLATKFQDDFYYDNKAFEFAGGVNVLHLHQLEIEVFQKLQFNLFVGEEDYQELQNKLYEVYGAQQDF